MLALEGGDERCHCRVIAKLDRGGLADGTFAATGGGDGFEAGRVAAEQGERPAGCRQRLGERRPDAARRAGDDDRFAVLGLATLNHRAILSIAVR